MYSIIILARESKTSTCLNKVSRQLVPTHVLIHYVNKTYSVHCASRLHIHLYPSI